MDNKNFEHNDGYENEIAARIMQKMVLFGGDEVGFNMNPEAKNRPNFINVNGEKVVCLAQGGECRVYGEFYGAGGLNNADSWKTPIISESCPNECPYKYLVCDDHEEGSHKEDIFQIT